MKRFSIPQLAGLYACVALSVVVAQTASAEDAGVVRIRQGSPEQVVRITDQAVIRGQSPQDANIQQVGLLHACPNPPDVYCTDCCTSGCDCCLGECADEGGHQCSICNWFKDQFEKFKCNCAENRLCLMEKFGYAPEGGCTMDDFVCYDESGRMRLDRVKVRAYRDKCRQSRMGGGRARGERVVMRNGRAVRLDRHGREIGNHGGRLTRADRQDMSRIEIMHHREDYRNTCREQTEKYGRPLANRIHNRFLHSKLNYFIPRGGCGAGVPPIGHYNIVYPVNPWHTDSRNGGVYAAEGVGGPVSVPLAPVVRHTYNYGWGIPSSRLTPISHLAPAPIPASYGPCGVRVPCGPYGCPPAYAHAQPIPQPAVPQDAGSESDHAAPAPPDPTGTANN